MSVNITIIMGRLVHDPEIRQAGETKIARYSLAVDRQFKKEGKAETDFFDCTAFGKSAEFAEKYLTKGMKIVARGRMECEPYTDKDGNKKYPWTLIVEAQDFAESKKAAEENESKSKVKTDKNGFVDVADGITEDLPFM